MKYTYEDYRALFFINRFVQQTQETSFSFMEKISKWAGSVGITVRKEKELPATYKKITKKMEFLLKEADTIEPSPYKKNITMISKLFRLTPAEENILEACWLSERSRFFRRFEDSYNFDTRLYGAFANIGLYQAQHLLNHKGKLRHYGLLDMTRYTGGFFIPMDICDILAAQYKDYQELKTAFLGKPIKNLLQAKDFGYIPETDFAVKLVKNSKKTKGFNILLYGMPGTGKTSFAQMLAGCAKLKMFTVAEEYNEYEEKNHRLQELYRKLNLLELEEDKQSCLLFDEAEDIFSSSNNKCDKVNLNRLLENNSCPVIWITNNITRMDPAFVRRFTLAIHFERPPEQIRQKIWSKHLKEYNLPHSAEQTLSLAKDFTVPPSMIEGAAKTAKLVKGDLNTVRQHLSIMTQALRGGRKIVKEDNRIEAFNEALINANMDLNQLASRLKELGRLNFSLCLYGASGTGKSAYARHLAKELGLPPLQKRASDLISPMVGETEQNIAGAFAQARKEKALLIFDEADSFLQDRTQAQRNWEVTCVNEMLTWMEKHHYPFICTTNLMDRLDSASLRRFSFKVRYDFLNIKQVQCAFKYFFNTNIDESEAQTLTMLTPGDFALVKSKADILGLKQVDKLKELLEAEQELKSTRGKNSIGFCA